LHIKRIVCNKRRYAVVVEKEISLHSKKEEIWAEKERLERELKRVAQRLSVLDLERDSLREENLRLEEKMAFLEDLREEVKRLNEKLVLLATLTSEINSLNPERIFELCVTKIPFLFNARCASIFLYDEEKNKLILKGQNHDRVIDPEVDLGSGVNSLMAKVLEKGEIFVISDIEAIERSLGAPVVRRFAGAYLTKSCIVAPLKVGEKVMGVLNLADPMDEKPFGRSEDIKLAKHVSELLAISIKNYQLFREIEGLTQMDALTKLSNHPFFFESLDREISRAERYGLELALAILDIDGFRLINDNFGHQAGDEILQDVARLLRTNLRTIDLVARFGADEFAIIFPQQDTRGAGVAVTRLLGVVRGHVFRRNEQPIRASLSGGIARFDRGLSSTEFMKLAEKALARAKSEGGDRVSFRG
jgi:diguanylate cyclase (GGDEF)-like protein